VLLKRRESQRKSNDISSADRAKSAQGPSVGASEESGTGGQLHSNHSDANIPNNGKTLRFQLRTTRQVSLDSRRFFNFQLRTPGGEIDVLWDIILETLQNAEYREKGCLKCPHHPCLD